MQRYFTNQEIKTEYKLDATTYHHAVVVLRMKVGSQFELVDAKQTVYLMELSELANKEAKAKVISKLDSQVELPLAVSIACGLSKGDKAEWIVQKGTELGASEFIFFKGDYSVAKWDQKKAKKKVDRLQKIAQGAAEQSHRTKIPTVRYVESLKELTTFEGAKFLAYEEAAKQGETKALVKLTRELRTKAQPLLAVFGPEGGISPAEVTLAKQAGFVLGGLGPRILRAETAPLYLLASLSYALELE